MSFKPVRTFLTNRLLEVDSDFEVFDSPFDAEDIGANDFNKRFHIFYGSVTTTVANQNTTQDDVLATVTLSFNGYNSATDALDDAMDIANQYRIQCLKPVYLRSETFIKRVVCESIQADPLPTNENAILIRLQFRIRVIFGLGVNLDC